MKLRLTRRAARNLADIADYLRERNPEAALRVRAAIVKSLQNLVLFPQAGRKQEVEGVRKIVTRRHSARAREHSDA
jgi:toxin ParE1/3/4